jgi:hypothetical protein
MYRTYKYCKQETRVWVECSELTVHPSHLAVSRPSPILECLVLEQETLASPLTCIFESDLIVLADMPSLISCVQDDLGDGGHDV